MAKKGETEGKHPKTSQNRQRAKGYALWLGLGAVAAAAMLIAVLLGQPTEERPKAPSAEPGPELSEGAAAPPFTLTSATGKAVSLADYRGKKVLLYFSMGPG